MSRSAGGLLTAQTWPVIPLVSKVWIALRQQGREELERDIFWRLMGAVCFAGKCEGVGFGSFVDGWRAGCWAGSGLSAMALWRVLEGYCICNENPLTVLATTGLFTSLLQCAKSV